MTFNLLTHNGQPMGFLNPEAQMHYKIYKRKLHSQVQNSHCLKAIINSPVKHRVLVLIRRKCAKNLLLKRKSSPSWPSSSGFSKDLSSEPCWTERKNEGRGIEKKMNIFRWKGNRCHLKYSCYQMQNFHSPEK